MARQLHLPGIHNNENPNQEPYKDHDFKRKDGTPRTPKGIERRLRAKKDARWTEEERQAHETYENGGPDLTDGEVYYSWHR